MSVPTKPDVTGRLAWEKKQRTKENKKGELLCQKKMEQGRKAWNLKPKEVRDRAATKTEVETVEEARARDEVRARVRARDVAEDKVAVPDVEETDKADSEAVQKGVTSWLVEMKQVRPDPDP